MANSLPTWAILDDRVWSIVDKSSARYVGARRVVIKYVYRLSTAVDSEGRRLLWAPFHSNFANENRQNCISLSSTENQTKSKRDNQFNHRQSSCKARPLSDGAKKANSESHCMMQDSIKRRLYHALKTEGNQEILRMDRIISFSNEASYLSNSTRSSCSSPRHFTPHRPYCTYNRTFDRKYDSYRNMNSERVYPKDKKYNFRDSNKLISSKVLQNGVTDDLSRGLIIKYVYYLNVNKDSKGKPITWEADDISLLDSNNNICLGQKNPIDTNPSQSLRLIKYKYVTSASELHQSEQSEVEEFPSKYLRPNSAVQSGPAFTLKLKETSLFTPGSLHTDPDLIQILSKTKSLEQRYGEVFLEQALSANESLWKRASPCGHCLHGNLEHEKLLSTQNNNSTINDVCKTSNFSHYYKKSVMKTCISGLPNINYKRNKTTQRTKESSSSTQSDIKKVTFKAIYGIHSYTAIFELDDNIDLLKTFIYVISGLPPRRQKYFPFHKTTSKKKPDILRDLGFNDGDVVHLDVVDSTK